MKSYLRAVRELLYVNRLETAIKEQVCSLLNSRYPEFTMRHLPQCAGVRAALPNGAELRLWPHGNECVANHVKLYGWTGHEPEALPLFYALAEKAAIILDIGAHVGLYSLTASYANPRAHILAFEPLPSVRDRLASNIRANRRANIEVVPCAVSGKSGTQPFYYVTSFAPHKGGISSLSRDYMTLTFPKLELLHVQVDVTTIDEFCEKRGVGEVSLAKLDIETLEPQAIAGMANTIRRYHPHLFVEILKGEGTDVALDSLARQFGYNVFALDAAGPQFQPRIVVCEERRNYLFTVMSPVELYELHRSRPMKAATTQ